MVDKIDTSKLGAVKVDANNIDFNARLVRQALDELSKELAQQHWTVKTDNMITALRGLRASATNEQLDKLRRMLK